MRISTEPSLTPSTMFCTSFFVTNLLKCFILSGYLSSDLQKYQCVVEQEL